MTTTAPSLLPTMESLITILPSPPHSKLSPHAPPSAAAHKTAAAASLSASVTSVPRVDPFAKGQQALRAAIVAKGYERRHWEHPIAPFLEPLLFRTQFNPYSLSCPVVRTVVEPPHKQQELLEGEQQQALVLVVVPQEQSLQAEEEDVTAATPSERTVTSLGGGLDDDDDTAHSSISSQNGTGMTQMGKEGQVSDSGNLLLEEDEAVELHSVSVLSELHEGKDDDDAESRSSSKSAVVVVLPSPSSPTVLIQTPQSNEEAPVGTQATLRPPKIAYRCLWYYRVPTTFPKPIVLGRRCAWALEHCVRRKLGGVCCDAHPLTIANMIYEATEIVPMGVDMFTNFKGRCSVWFETLEQAERVEAALHQRVWMAPIEHGYALWAERGVDAQFMLKQVRETMMLTTPPANNSTAARGGRGRAAGGAACAPKHFAFPTHLLTVEAWETR